MREKLSLEEFNEIKRQLDNIIVEARDVDVFADDIEEVNANFIDRYYSLQNRLLSYDLSLIPASLYDGMIILSDKDGNISFDGTNANLDFRVLDLEPLDSNVKGKVSARGCHIENLDFISYYYDRDSFDPGVVPEEYFGDEEMENVDLRKQILNGEVVLDKILELDDKDFSILINSNIVDRVRFGPTDDGVLYSELAEKIGKGKTLQLIRNNRDLTVDFLTISRQDDGVDFIDELISLPGDEQREKVFEKQKENIALFVKSNETKLDPDKFSNVFYNQYIDIFKASLDYKTVSRYAKEFKGVDLTQFLKNKNYTKISYSLGFSQLVDCFNRYQTLFEHFSEASLMNNVVMPKLADDINVMAYNDYTVEPRDIFKRALGFVLTDLLVQERDNFTLIHDIEECGYRVVNINGFDALMNADENCVYTDFGTTNLVKYLGIDNLKRLAMENNIFGNSDYQFQRVWQGFRPFNTQVSYDISYDEFLERFKSVLVQQNYRYVEGQIREQLSDLFIPRDAPEELQQVFYGEHLTLHDLKKHPEWIEWLDNISLKHVLNYTMPFKKKNNNFSNSNEREVYDFLDVVTQDCGSKVALEILAPYAEIFDNKARPFIFQETFTLPPGKTKADREDYEKFFADEVFGYIFTFDSVIEWDKLDLPDQFKNYYFSLFLDPTAPEELKEKFYSKSITLQYLMDNKDKNIIPYLMYKDISIVIKILGKSAYSNIGNNLASEILFTDASRKDILEVLSTYGPYLERVSAKDIKDKERLFSKENGFSKDYIEELIYNAAHMGRIVYDEDAPSFLREKNPRLFLPEDAPSDLKDAFYHRKNTYFTFYTLAVHPEWKPYLKNVDIKQALLVNNQQGYRVNNYFDLFGEELAVKFAINKSQAVGTMILQDKVDLMHKWFLRTGSTFLPSAVVMQAFSEDEMDKFFEYKNEWSRISRNGTYNVMDDSLEALLKLSYVFGIFDGDRKAETKLSKIISDVPDKISGAAMDTLISKFVGSNEYELLLESIKAEKIPVDCSKDVFSQLYAKTDNGYRLRINMHKYPKTSKSLRSICQLEKIGGVLSARDLHLVFGGLNMKYDPDFSNFIVKNIEEIVTNKDYYSKLKDLQESYDRYRNTILSGDYNIDRIFGSLTHGVYTNVEVGNQELSQVITHTKHTQSDFEILQKLYNYGKLRSHSSIPRVKGKVGELSYEMLRLDDPLALAVGYHTDCCQDIGEPGAWCMAHSMTEKNGRVMVVRDENDVILAQSWVWREKDLICFDDVEFGKSKPFIHDMTKRYGTFDKFTDQVLQVYRQVGKEIIDEDEKMYSKLLTEGKITEEQYKTRVSKITMGPGYNESKSMVERNLEHDNSVKVPEVMNYIPPVLFGERMYSDALEQYVLDDTGRGSYTDDADSLFVYTDELKEYSSENEPDVDTCAHLADLEKATLGECDVTSGLDLKTDPLSHLADAYNVPEEDLRIIVNPNFALICGVSMGEVSIEDLFFNTNMTLGERKINPEEEVSSQIALAMEQLHNEYGDIRITPMEDNKLEMLEKVKDKIDSKGEDSNAKRV